MSKEKIIRDDIEIRFNIIRGGRSCRTFEKLYYIYSNGQELHDRYGRKSFFRLKDAKAFLEEFKKSKESSKTFRWYEYRWL